MQLLTIRQFTESCERDGLQLNAKKTKEMIIDFSRNDHQLQQLRINNENIERTSSYKYLGTTITQDLKWDKNIKKLCLKAWKKMCYVRMLRMFNINGRIISTFYRSVVESTIRWKKNNRKRPSNIRLSASASY